MSLPVVYHPDYFTPLPAGHRFPMEKFRGVFEVLLRDGVIAPGQVHTPDPAAAELIQAVHHPDYVAAYLAGTLESRAMRRIGLPWSDRLVRRTCTAVGGTLRTAELALAHGLACNTAGGTHHAFPGFGSGFCIFNDLAVAARTLLDRGTVARILIVDLDVHQGDGTAVIFREEPRVFTFSMHCRINFPFVKQQSDLDVELPEGVEDEAYLHTLDGYLPDLVQRLRPDLVLYDAGVDPHREDRLGRLRMTDDGLYRRDFRVIAACVSRGIPVACVIGGGYSEDIGRLAFRHSLLHRAASAVFEAYRL
jgi:acetoin utilization deacetylase AcuC-like enzyme